MKISSNSRYKSLEQFQEFQLPDFVVLYGINGAGKTHLLQVLANQNVTRITDDSGADLPRRKFVDANTLAPNNSTVVSWDTLKQAPISALSWHTSYKQNKQNNPNFTLHNVTGDPRHHKLFETISKSADKTLDDLDSEDIFEHYPMNDGLENNDVFSQSFSQLFKRYQVRKLDNEFNEFRNQKDKKVKFLSEASFLKRYGEAPWEFVNKIIAEAKLNYHINSPVNQDRDAPFELKLVNDINGAEINFNDLSGGEKVLMSLALSLYNSNYDIEYPQVLLMDKPDAPLHPSMTKQFLQVIENVFVKGKNVKVILTTHSPSTVALAPENSLYQMNKNNPRIVKTTKDKALKILTFGVPSLSITYENRRQVFVESNNDVKFYERVYEKLRDKLVDEISINFISSGVGGQGNCDQVKEIVNQLTRYGNNFIYGIVDWDLKNNGNDHIKVLGYKKRYSIESYIFDPLLLAAFLLREKYIERQNVGLQQHETYTDFIHFDSDKLQSIVNFILLALKDKLTSQDTTSQACTLVNSKSVSIPNWYLMCNGHDLELAIKEEYQPLKKYTKEGELKSKIIETVIDDIPSMLSVDLMELLLGIQNYTEPT